MFMSGKVFVGFVVRLGSAMTSCGRASIRRVSVVMTAMALATACTAPARPQASSLPEQNIVAVVSHNTIHEEFHEEERVWQIPGTGIYRAQYSKGGRVVSEMGVGADGTRVTVLHDSGTYRVEPPVPCTDLAKCGPGLPSEPDIFTSAGVRQLMTDGSLAVVDSDVEIDGRPAVHLRGSNFQISLSGTLDIWVDPSTHLPFRYQVSGSSTERDATVTYIPPTLDNLSHLVVPIPAGFTEQQKIEGQEIVRAPGG